MDDRPARIRWKWVAGIALILGGIGTLAAWAIASPGALAYYKTPSEITVMGEQAMGRSLRLGGRVADGTLVRNGSDVRFVVTDGHNRIRVAYHGDVPDTLKESTDVVAEGTLTSSGMLRATRVLAKCSSKFKPTDKTSKHYR